MVDATASVCFQRWAGKIVKLCDQPVDLLIGPIVEKIGVGQLWGSGLHCGGLFDCTLFDTMTVIRRKAGESLLKGVDVEEGDGKGPMQQLVQPSRQGTSPSKAAVAR